MVIDTVKENLCINKKITSKREIIFVEGDVIVPDTKPDILNVICTSGIPCIYKKEIVDGKLKLDGKVDTYIMYMSDDEKERIRGINSCLDFSEIIALSNIDENVVNNINAKVKEIEARVINERKLSIKATVELKIEVFLKEEISIINDIEDSKQIKMLQEELTVNSLIGRGETKIYAKDNISIDTIDNLVEILKLDMSINNKDIKISYNKVLTKAEAEVKIVYLTDDNRISKAVTKIPIIGFIDVADVNEGNKCDTNYEIRNIIVKPNSMEEHSVYIEIEVGVSTTVYSEKKINIIQDLYSPCENIEFNKKSINTISNKKEVMDIKEITEKMQIEELKGKKIIDVDINPNIIKESVIDNKLVYNCEAEIKFMLVSEDLQSVIKKENITFDYSIEGIEQIDNYNIDTSIEVANQDFIIQNEDEILAKIKLVMNSNLEKKIKINTIDEIQSNGVREEQDYSIIMYVIKKGDTLWNIAKRFGSTIDDIVRVNGIENPNVINEGEKIFIPRYKNSGGIREDASMINYA